MKTPFFLFIIITVNFFILNKGLTFQKTNQEYTIEKTKEQPSVDFYITQAMALKLYEEKQWIDLLHIRPNIFGLERSQVKGKTFFLANDGYKNSKTELEATIKELLSEKEFPEDKHPLCSFPARKRWLQEKLQISDDRFPKPKCKLFDYYMNRLNAESVSIIFSSYYPNNPGSVFGHTLFRINKKLKNYEKRNELLDHGIGYAANANVDNPVLYAAYGLFGGFQGVFSNVPYYYKVREYNDFESRSLWSYDLNLTSNELNYVVEHLWEVGSSYFDYYFFTQNCGFHMLTVLEAAVPRIKVVENIPFWVIPSDAVKVINREPELVKNITYRPSVEEKFYKRWKNLNENEKKYLIQWKKSNSFDGIELLNESERINVLDTALDFFDYKNPNVQNEGFEYLQSERNQLLLARAKILKPSVDLDILPPHMNRPEVGHESGRMGFRLGQRGDLNSTQVHSYQELQVRFALHDLLDSSYGYPPGANIEFMNFRFRHWDPKGEASDKNQLEEFTLFRLLSLYPIDEFHRSPSWAFSVTSKRIYDEIHCFGCFAGGIEGGIGATLRSSISETDYFLFFNSSLLYSKEFRDSHLLWSGGPQLGILNHFNDFSIKIAVESKWSIDKSIENKKLNHLVAIQELEFRHNFLKDWSWGFNARAEDQTQIYDLNLFRFF